MPSASREFHEDLDCEYLVIGSGIAGLMLALKLAESAPVIVICKETLAVSNSVLAQGGIAAVHGPDDSFAEHYHDTIIAGAGLCHPDIVRLVVNSGPAVIRDLIGFGVEFTRDPIHKSYHLTKEGGHHFRRIFHHRDSTGNAIVAALVARVREHKAITVLEQNLVTELLVTQTKHAPPLCWGAKGFDRNSLRKFVVNSAYTFLSTGGHGRIYRSTTNPPGATGDGLAMAWRVGCRVANLEFMQFHPTVLDNPEGEGFLISEALRGEGGILINAAGQEFMSRYHPLASLAPRDIVARGIYVELCRSTSPCVYLDMGRLSAAKIRGLFPNIYARCLALGIDITQTPIPVVPAAHYCCGGVVVDAWGQTDVSHLYAVGEVAFTGLHGANRLASNSLLEAAVFARRAAAHAHDHPVAERKPREIVREVDEGARSLTTYQATQLLGWLAELRSEVSGQVGIIRSDIGLQQALARVTSLREQLERFGKDAPPSALWWEALNLADVSLLTIRSALQRKESRGCHYSQDYPQTDRNGIDTILTSDFRVQPSS